MDGPIMQQAIATIKQAVDADTAGEHERALELYSRAIRFFMHEIKYSRAKEYREHLTRRVSSYMDRAEALKRALDHATKPTASASGARASSAASNDDSDPDDDGFDLRRELARRVGMRMVKQQLLDFEHTLSLDRRRRDLKPDVGAAAPFPHLLFKGPPGCGKTSMARLLARALRALGVLEKGHLVEVQRGDLVAGHIGQTALRTRDALERARGGVLFVDECYRLSPSTPSDFGHEAIDELMAAMEAGDPCIIFAGYNDAAMDAFVSSNPGLFRRIQRTFVFDAYTSEELARILLHKVDAAGFALAPPFGPLASSGGAAKDDNVGDARAAALGASAARVARLLEAHTTRAQRERMNGGLCDHVLRNAKRSLDARLTLDASLDQLLTYSADDFVAACAELPIPPDPKGAPPLAPCAAALPLPPRDRVTAAPLTAACPVALSV